MPALGIGTVAVEMAYEDALRLWVLVHDPANAGQHIADRRICKLVTDAIAVVEGKYASSPTETKGPSDG